MDERKLLLALSVLLISGMLPLTALGMPAKRCQSDDPQPAYLATFEVSGEGTEPKKMVFCVSEKPASKVTEKALVSAEIWSERGREAVCEQKYFEREGNTPLSLILECRSTHFNPLITPVTLYWPSTDIRQPVLRFGTWLNGYIQAPVKVQRDELSKPVSVAARVAKSD